MPASALAAAGGTGHTLDKPSGNTPTTAVTTTTTAAPVPNGQAKGQTNGNATTPVTKGTAKKLTSSGSQQTTSPGQTVPTSSSSTPTRRRPHRQVQTTSATTRTAHSTRPATAHHAKRRVVHTVRKHRTNSATFTTPASSGSTPAATVAVRRGATHSKKHRPTHSTSHAAKATKPDPVIGFDSINRAADRVIQVIPGIVLLALGALGGLVALLTVRSLITERRRAAELRASYAVTVQALATAIEAKDHTTGGHIERVRELGLLLARRLVPREAKDAQMAYGFLLHDIGKLAIPDSILRKSGRLDEREWTLMRRHPEEGVRILGSIPFLDKALDVVRYHHERWDGSGYPNGMAADEIPLWARIFAVVDALDAITAERPYRSRRPYADALEEIRLNAGSQFDPAVVDALEALEVGEVERLLEPAQILDRHVGDPNDLEPLEAILEATEAARVDDGDVAVHSLTAA